MQILSNLEALGDDEDLLINEIEKNLINLGFTKYKKIHNAVYKTLINNNQYIMKIILNGDCEYKLSNILSLKNIENIYSVHKLYKFKIMDTNSSDYIKFNIVTMPKYKHNLSTLKYTLLKPETKKSIYTQLINGINEIHKLGFSHGDIKPTNICYDNNKVYIIDFGLSEELVFKNKKYTTIGTFGWFTPVQSLSSKHFEKKETESIKSYLLKYSDDLYDNYICNDYFNIALVMIFIYGDKYNFYTKSNKISLFDVKIKDIIYKNMISFIQNPIQYILDILIDIQMFSELDDDTISIIFEYILCIIPNR